MKILSVFILTIMMGALIACGEKEDEAENFTDTMAREHVGDKPTGNDVAWLEPAQPVDAQEISYSYGGTAPANAYLARPAGSDSALPGVLMIHEWWGLNDNMKAMARRMAGEGYIALAANLYGGKAATTPDEAKAYMEKALKDSANGLKILEGGIKALKERGATKIGVIGWCFGGGWSLRTAFSFPEDIDGAVIYYGHLENDPDRLKKLDMPVLGIFGALDQGIPVEQVKQFQAMLDSLGVDASIHIYPNANHAFANPSGERYNAEAAKDAWSKTTAFFAEHLR